MREQKNGTSAKTPAHHAWQTCFPIDITGQKSSIQQENAPDGTSFITIPMKKHLALPKKGHNHVISHHRKDQELAGYTKSLQFRTISQ
ncbi:hypothetical protein LU298_04880 [Komagataeibacter intermedius]|uniref:hypothetical protein n=1 Tax=Komagataeibacter intermedius TaxID=66229 RepID=UPI000584BEE6|nr:hypothetical protein [Komagataeibacter intermedius]MCF3635833.1 hypothetical protein [Komagataeibacter intermedius]